MPKHGFMAALACAAWTPALATAPALAGAAPTSQPERLCGGYPRLPIETIAGMCAGLVFGPEPRELPPSKRLLHLPRTLLQLPGGEFLVVDLGGWEAGQGSVWRLKATPGAAPTLSRVLDGLNLPHTIALGPDGKVYLGEMDRIIRFDPAVAASNPAVETVISGLPGNRLHDNRHPLSAFMFDANNDLLVNVGAPSDQCAPQGGAVAAVCGEVDGDPPRAAIWRFAYEGNGAWSKRSTVFATGLRNSVALVRHGSGSLFQAENSIDLAAPDAPYDEINRLERGRNYGWPYCMDAASPTPAWRETTALRCADKRWTKPTLLLPPHSAPISMVYYQGTMFPELTGRLVVTLHGYRSAGARIVAYTVDTNGAPKPSRNAAYSLYRPRGAPPVRRRYAGAPAATGLTLTPRWDRVAGLRATGAPSGLTVASDGAIWVADDRNGQIIRFAREPG